jgi:AcrR family transcriptional regulator
MREEQPGSEPLRREQILIAAQRLLTHYGVNKTTVADIAREASVGVGTVYLEFPSKEAIVEALSLRHHEQVMTEMRAAASKRRRYADRLIAILDTKVRRFLDLAADGAHAREMVYCVCPSVVEAHQRFQEEELSLVTALLTDADDKGEFNVAEPEVTAAALLRAYSAFSPPWVYAHPREHVEKLLPALHELVLRGLVRR